MDHTPLALSTSRRRFLVGAGAAFGASLLPIGAQLAGAEPHDDTAQWVANHLAARLVDTDGTAVAMLPRWTRMRVLQGRPGGWLEVWVPRFSLVGRVAVSAIGVIGAPSAAEMAQERAENPAPELISAVGLPARVVGGANLRLWPSTAPDTLLRPLGHNASLRAIDSVVGDDGDEWLHVNWLGEGTNEPRGEGYVHGSLVRLPRIQPPANPDRVYRGRWFEADLKEPVLLTAFEDGAAVWSSLSLKGRSASSTSLGEHQITRQVPNETMNSETLIPPVPRTAPGGYYLKNVLYTQYFTWDGQSIHYNYWASNWGYAGSNGCLGLPLPESKFCWDFAEVGTRVRIFA